ncbi:diguanylate cyclase [Azotosporobacter soli]|uniref:sensor domain-containing diguanylate cyclase n=1 Tax=Azotosporobacter soli TaxID=3055040 RepID=UPI0031FEF609
MRRKNEEEFFLTRLWRNLSLRQKLGIAFVIMTTLPLLTTTLITWRPYEEAMTLAVEERNQEQAEQIASEIDWTFAEKIRMLNLLANNEEILSMNPARQQPVLRYIVEQYPDVQLAVVADRNGRQVARWDGKKPDTTIDYNERPYFQVLKQSGKTAISEVLRAYSTRKLGIVIAEPIYRENESEMSGVLIINLELEKLIQRIGAKRSGQSGAAYVINQQGKVIIHPELGLIENGMDESSVAPVRTALLGESGWLEYERDGKLRLVGYSPVARTKMGVIVEQAKEEAMRSVDEIKRRSLIVLVLATTLAVALGLAIAGALSKPIVNIAEAVKRLGTGDWGIRLRTKGQDEINQLAHAFNSLAEQLARRDAEIGRARESLERQVEERTRALQSANEELRLVSQLDGLTGIANRRSFDAALQREWKRGLRDQTSVALIMLDADQFKSYNDTYGHLAGDECLKFIAAELKTAAKRASDLAGRFGGEEFVLLLPECDLQGAAQIAEQMRHAIEAANLPHAGSSVASCVTVSLGVAAVLPTLSLEADILVAAADRAMYRAKQAGRNRVCLQENES